MIFCALTRCISTDSGRSENISPIFIVPQASLVIELDGSQHCEPAAQSYDAARTAYLASLGLHVLRIPNNALSQNFPATCDYIDAVIKKRLKQK